MTVNQSSIKISEDFALNGPTAFIRPRIVCEKKPRRRIRASKVRIRCRLVFDLFIHASSHLVERTIYPASAACKRSASKKVWKKNLFSGYDDAIYEISRSKFLLFLRDGYLESRGLFLHSYTFRHGQDDLVYNCLSFNSSNAKKFFLNFCIKFLSRWIYLIC